MTPTPCVTIGVDIGATKVVAGVVDERGRILEEGDRRVHRNDGPRGVLRSLEATLDALDLARHGAAGIGVAIAAQVDPARGRVLYAPNLRWRDVPLGPWLARRHRLPVVLENDVRAATWGEWHHGRYARVGDLGCLFVGTGVGGGFVVDGRLLGGAVHAAGEVGHLTLVASGRKCSCPNRGCLEAYVGGWAIAARAREALSKDPRAGAELLRRCGSRARVSATAVTAAARDGDPFSVALMRETGALLGAGAVSVVNAFDPACLLLGGGVVEGWPRLVGDVRRAVARHAQPPAARAVTVEQAHLGPMAPVLGAAALARAAVPRGRGTARK